MTFKNRVNDDEIIYDDGIKKNNNNVIIIIGVITISLLFIGAVFMLNNKEYSITLNGDSEITIYQNDKYIEPGYRGSDENNNDLTDSVEVYNNIDTSLIGTQYITYKLKNISITRMIHVVKKEKVTTNIILKGDKYFYLNKDDKYIEPGYTAYDSNNNDLTNKVKIHGTVNVNKSGLYLITYSVVNINNVTTSVQRTVIIMNTNVNMKLSTNTYTNKEVTINVSVNGNFYEYMILPNGEKTNKANYQYTVNKNGKYKFTIYSKKGNYQEKTIEVNNIDTTGPSGNCKVSYSGGYSIITINSSDQAGIKKYVYNNSEYQNNTIKINGYINKATVSVYDNANNISNIQCSVEEKLTISSISNDGIIVNIKSQKINNNIKGYYFSYNSNRPDRNGGYIATDRTSIDVVRLPGTTYVWVEDSNGNISEPKTINISNKNLIITGKVSGYSILNESLSSFLTKQGSSLQELNNLIYRSVRAAGLNTKIGAATAAVSMQGILAQKYKIKIPYNYGRITWTIGAYGNWGLNNYGMSCDGMVDWSYINAGIGIKDDYLNNNYYLNCYKKDCGYRKENGEIGDILANSHHVRIIVGKEGNTYIVAEEYSTYMGAIINYHTESDYIIINGDYLLNKYTIMNPSQYPSGF